MKIAWKIILLAAIYLLMAGTIFADELEVLQSLESRVLQAKKQLKDLDFGTIEMLLAEIRGGSKHSGEIIEKVENLLVESLKVETRAIWLDSVSMNQLTTRKKIVELMDILKSINVNLILADIFGNGHSVFPSKVATQREAFTYLAGEDLVPVMIEEAHARGIEFHGLASLFGVDSKGIEPFMDNLDWFDRTAEGSFLTGVTSFEAFMSPVVSEVREFLMEVVKEIANYDVDGIHLDYIRYGRNLGYHPLSLELYIAEGGNPENLADPNELARFRAFKAKFISSFVDEVRKEVYAINPKLILSAAVGSPLASAQNDIGQDWKAWADRRLLHLIFHMGYVPTTELYNEVIDNDTSPIARTAISFPGVGVYAIDKDELQSQLELGQNKPVSGQALFSTIHLTSEKAEVLRNGVYRDPAMPTYRDPQKAAAKIVGDLGRRIEVLAPEIGLEKELANQLVLQFLDLEADVLNCPLRPWDNRDLHEGSEKEIEVLEYLLDQFRTARRSLSGLPKETRERVINDLIKAERLISVLHHYAKPMN